MRCSMARCNDTCVLATTLCLLILMGSPGGCTRPRSPMLLEAVTDRWVRILRAMSARDFARRLIHPEHEKPLSLDQMLALYEWHGRHHIAHVNLVRGA